MALDTQAGLIAHMTAMLNRPDLTANIPDLIVLVEARLRRELRTKNVTLNTALVASVDGTPLPADVKELLFVALDTIGAVRPVSPAEFYTQQAQSAGVAAAPTVVCQIGDTLYFDPPPDQDYAVTVIYEPSITPLASAEGGTNWVLAQYPDLYTYGIAVEAAPWLRDDPRVATFEPRFQQALAELELLRDRTNYPNTPVAKPKRVF